jgi:hypothetical protein
MSKCLNAKAETSCTRQATADLHYNTTHGTKKFAVLRIIVLQPFDKFIPSYSCRICDIYFLLADILAAQVIEESEIGFITLRM